MNKEQIANLLTTPMSTKVYQKPSDLGMEFEEVIIKTNDNVEISTWIIRGNNDKIVISSHWGMNSSKSGYNNLDQPEQFRSYNKNIDFNIRYKKFLDEGYTVVAFDHRNQGDSSKSEIGINSSGKFEEQDWVAVINDILGRDEYKNSSLYLLGICMSANAIGYAYGNENNNIKNIDNIKAIALVQPSKAAIMLKNAQIPEQLIKDASDYNESRGGNSFFASAKDVIENINKPTIVMQNSNDPWMDPEWVKDLYNKITVEKEYASFDLAKERFDLYNEINENPKTILDFFRNK